MSLLKSIQMAKQQLVIAVAQVHAVSLTIAEIFAVSTLACLFPLPLTVGRKPVLPDLHEVILVDVALMKVGTDTCTGTYCPIGHHTTNRNAGLTGVKQITHLALIVAQEALAAVVHTDLTLLARPLYIVEHTSELLIGEPHHRVLGSPAYRENGEKTPSPDALRDEEMLDVVKTRKVTTVHAGNDVEEKSLLGSEHVNGLANHAEALRVASHPVVLVLQPVKADRHRADASPEKPLPSTGRQVEAVGHHPPGESLLTDGCTAVFKVLSHQRLPTSDDDAHLVGISFPGDGVEHTQEVLLGHVLARRLHLAVAAAVTAFQVAAQRTLPEELPQGVLLDEDGLLLPPKLEGNLLPKRQGCRLHLSSS